MAEPTTVLLIEDDAIIARDLKDTLEELGYRVLGVAATADEAMRFAALERPDVALSDVRIRGPRDGIMAADELRKRYHVPVVFLSAHSDEVTVARARRAAPFGYLVKPFRAMEVKCSIEVALYRADMERALAERQQWLETTLSSLDDAVVCSDADGNVRLMNRAAERLTGWTQGNAIGKPASEVVHLEARPNESPDPLGLAIANEGALVRRRGGGETPVMRRETPILDEGRALGSVLVMRDADEELRWRAQREFLERMAALGTLAASVAHEINNPLSVILGNLDLALAPDGDLSDQMKVGMFADAREAATRIRTIVADLRGLWQPQEAGSNGIANVERTVAWALDVTSHETRHFARVDALVEPGLTVAVSHVRLGQVLINLIRNGAQAIQPQRSGGRDHHEGGTGHSPTPSGARKGGYVRVEAQRLGDRCLIRVSDSGPGIPADVQERMFEPFFTTRAGDNGMGLGLFVSRSIVLNAGGELKVQSTLGVGTTFTVILPLASAPEQTTPFRLPEGPVNAQRARILLVDDDPATLMVLRRVLERAHEVVTANGGYAALDRLAADRRFDLVLLDVMMPDLPGDRVREEVILRYPEVEERIVLITAGAVSRSAKDLVTRLGNRVLRKPLAPDELLDAVQRHLAVQRAHAVAH